MDRRSFLRNSILLAAGSLLACKEAKQSPAMKANGLKSLGLQIYSLQQELYDDLPARLAQLKAMGYENLELAGYANGGRLGTMSLKEFKQMVEDAGMHILSSHVSPNREGVPYCLDYTDENLPNIYEYWKATAADHAEIGCKYLIQPVMPTMNTHDQAKYVCNVLNKAADIIRSEGIETGFGFHNHNMKFERIQTPEQKKQLENDPFAPMMKVGDLKYDVMLQLTDPSKVYFEMDVYWTVMAKCDPVAYLKQYPDRIKVLHMKDVGVFGESGMMNFEAIFNQMYANGIKDYFVELEGLTDGRTQFEGVKACADYLQKASFVK